MAARAGKGPLVAINVTPLVDVMLVLLAIFMITARLMDDASAVPLDLPKAATGNATQAVLQIAIDAQGRRRANGEPIADDQALRAVARREHARNPELRTVLQAARRTPHEHVVGTLDALRVVGISRIAFAVEPVGAADQENQENQEDQEDQEGAQR